MKTKGFLLLHYLLEKGLLTPDQAINANLTIQNSSSRNENYQIYGDLEPGIFVKKIKIKDQQSIRALEREAEIYHCADANQTFVALSKIIPRYQVYDPYNHLLAIDLVSNSENLREFHMRIGQFPSSAATILGQSIRCYHEEVEIARAGISFPRKLPWILTIDQIGRQIPLGEASQHVLTIIREFPEFGSHLDELRSIWTPTALIHGDMKWENCLIFEENNQLKIQIVDWETADIGDPAWDVGAIFQAFIVFWIYSIPFDGEHALGELIHKASFPIERMQPAIKAFWESYTQNISSYDRLNFLNRSTRFAAARMLVTAYEHMHQAQHMSMSVLGLIQVSLNMFADPLIAAEELLGIVEKGDDT